jgi:toxin ParE1/3/4
MYTVRNWGQAQSERYMSEMEKCIARLIHNPILGRPCEEIGAGLHRLENGRHVIFYRQQPDGILIIRILHRSMLPHRHSFDT